MKQLSNRTNFGIGVLAAACTVGMAACSSEDTPSGGGETPTECSGAPLEIFFKPMYSAFDGNQHTFQIPAIADGVSATTVKWSASPKELVALDQRPNLVMITTQGVGKVTISAQAGNRCGSSELNIGQATPEEWAAGDARYNNGQKLVLPQPPYMRPADGGNILEANGSRPACTNCHGATATSGVFNGITHTPQQIGGFTDDELVQVMVAGVIPPGGYYNENVGIQKEIWSFFHRWTLTPQEQRGLVVYLRALTPATAGGSIDFSGVGRGQGGSSGMGGAGGTSGASGMGGTGTGGTGTGGTGTGGTGTGGTGTGGTGTGGTGTGGTGTGGTGGT